jgi:hypothetical protein
LFKAAEISSALKISPKKQAADERPLQLSEIPAQFVEA